MLAQRPPPWSATLMLLRLVSRVVAVEENAATIAVLLRRKAAARPTSTLARAHIFRKARPPARRPHPCASDQGLAHPRRMRGRPAPAPPARKRQGLPDRPPSHQCTRLPGRPRPREITQAGGRTHRDARPTRRQTSSPDTPRNGRRNPVKRLPTPLPGSDSRPL